MAVSIAFGSCVHVQDFPGVVPDVITFNVGIAAYMARNLDDRAFKLLEEMNRREIRPRADTFNSILTGLTKVWPMMSSLLPLRDESKE